MYLRFTGKEIDLRSGNPKGIISVAYDLIESNELLVYEYDMVMSVLHWFNCNLRVPNKFSRSRNSYNKNNRGLSWVKSASSGVVGKLMELKALIEMKGILIDIQKTKKPGYIVYEDEHQVVAEPFNKNRIDLL